LVSLGTNALASSIILVCRKRADELRSATRREFVAPVDLAQAAIGPGMAVFTRYDKVLDADGQPVSVREALASINATLDEAPD
jgi:putative DNA methylase